MMMDSSRTETGTDKSQVKLKFGIERLLSTEPSCNIRLSVSRPLPTVAVPCSDCVTSLFRCCRLGPTNARHQEEGFLSQNHNTFASLPASSTAYTVHPIKPFPTRPSKY